MLNQSRQSLVQTRQSLVDDVMGIDLVRKLVMLPAASIANFAILS